jgi:hypothetical protein
MRPVEESAFQEDVGAQYKSLAAIEWLEVPFMVGALHTGTIARVAVGPSHASQVVWKPE